MDPIANISLPLAPAYTPPASTKGGPDPVLPKAADIKPKAPDFVSHQEIQKAEQQRYEAVQLASREIANHYVLGDQHFTIFKDSTGQYITRFTSMRTGQVTYIPEPQLLARLKQHTPAVTLDV